MDTGSERWKVVCDLLNSSPFYHYMDMKVVETGEGYAKLTLMARKQHQNLYGTVHGGALASVLDSSCTIAVGTLMEEDEVAVTVDMRINYISNISEGLLVGEGRVLHRGSRTGVAQGEVRDEKGKLLAAGMSTLFINRPQFD